MCVLKCHKMLLYAIRVLIMLNTVTLQVEAAVGCHSAKREITGSLRSAHQLILPCENRQNGYFVAD